MFLKKGVLRNFTKFTGKQLCQSLFFNKVAGGVNMHFCSFFFRLQIISKAIDGKIRNALCFEIIRSSHHRCSVKKDVLRNFTKFIGKHLCQSLILINFFNFIKKETLTQVFSCEFCEIFKNTFFTEHLWTTKKNASQI